jgi:hypothetical protein
MQEDRLMVAWLVTLDTSTAKVKVSSHRFIGKIQIR